MKMIMASLVAAAGLICATAAGALAADIGGSYSVSGTNFDGSRYRGTAEIVVTTKNTCRITWNTGSTAEGICMRNGDTFATAYSMGDVVGLVIYEIRPDGTLEGLWTVADREGVGTEVLTLQ